MSDMFVSPRGPFYNSTDILSLEVIRKEAYRDFAAAFFHRDGKAFSAEAFDKLYERFDGITWYVQSVLNRVWERATDGVVTAPTGKDFIARHSLGAASTVASVVEALIEKELLYRTEKGFVVYDRLFGEWLKSGR